MATPSRGITAARAAPVRPQAAPPDSFAQKRKAKPIEYLLPSAFQWFQGLPVKVRPVALVRKYPRIANVIARDWDDYRACSAYFDDLLTDSRGNRQGFPADVYKDLLVLYDHYQRERIHRGAGLSDA